MPHNKHPCSYTGYTFMLDFSSYTSLFFGFSSQASQVMENPPCVDVLPSWNLTYPLPRQFWRCVSFSQGGICQFPGGYPANQRHWGALRWWWHIRRNLQIAECWGAVTDFVWRSMISNNKWLAWDCTRIYRTILRGFFGEYLKYVVHGHNET